MTTADIIRRMPELDAPPAAACPVCGSTRFRTCARVNRYPLYRCGACGFRWSPPPGAREAARLYSASYYEGGDHSSVYPGGYGAAVAEAQDHARILDGLERMGPRGRLLDIGCAYGFFLESARDRGWDVRGVDVSDHAVRHARARLGPVVWLGTIASLRPDAGPFDAVTLLDTLEHLPDPVAMMAAARRHLRPSGILFIRTVDGDSLAARWLGSRWPQVKPPEHLVYPAPRHLMTWLRRTGFAPARIEWHGGLGLGWRASRGAGGPPSGAGCTGPSARRCLRAIVHRLLAACRATDMVHVYARCTYRAGPGP